MRPDLATSSTDEALLGEADEAAEDGRATAEEAEDRDMEDIDVDLRQGEHVVWLTGQLTGQYNVPGHARGHGGRGRGGSRASGHGGHGT